MITYLKIAIFFMALFGCVATIEHTLENIGKIFYNPSHLFTRNGGVTQIIPFYWALFTVINWTVFYALNQL
jgi:hypothetical protein